MPPVRAEVIHAAVGEEAAVFDGEHGIHHDLGESEYCHQAALGASSPSNSAVTSWGPSSYPPRS